ncbi:UNVERIFIED_CONTAM: hypothetical protein NCL1_56225 [Trichonephila clavipes]
MEWYEEQSECYPTQLQLLKIIRDLAAKKRRCKTVQSKISVTFHNKERFLHVKIFNIRLVTGFIY